MFMMFLMNSGGHSFSNFSFWVVSALDYDDCLGIALTAFAAAPDNAANNNARNANNDEQQNTTCCSSSFD